ncbi:Peptidase M50 [Syntrophomonas zehnderi OL-4]|uniref:Peptidase M50 n=1 Tax=Syntrophomonas zehnderi OL-4 TaxID=690567 RepID=A0A0E4GB67_9FIRM|nr:M50 family metallopeptidase [Syntrophomonas zehnderi]CFX80580.1 Peptidase M50 [Syntrophomonas zehnderi OL-4]
MLLGKLAGVRVRVNILFLLLCLIYTYVGLGMEILVIFTFVLLHELAHTIMAAVLRVKVAEIELLPFGGQAKIEDFTGLDPDKEIYIALAGPIMSLSLAAVFYFLPVLDSAKTPLLIQINLFLGIFNLLPALPLDGGRILRAYLSRLLGYKKATARSALLGKLAAVLIAGYGVFLFYEQQSGANFLLIAMLLFWAAHREGYLLNYAFMRYLVHKKSELSHKGFLASRQIVSGEDALIKSILDTTRPNFYTIVLILDEEHRPLGLRSEAELIDCLFEKGPRTRLKDC